MIKFIATILTFLSFACQTSATEFYVSLQGNDAWSGRLATANVEQSDGPFRTLAFVQSAIRKVRNSGSNQQITLVIREGLYQLSQPLMFDNRDSGSASAPVTWSSYPGESVTISGGRKINTCSQQEKQIINCSTADIDFASLKKIKNNRMRGNSPPFQLFQKEKRLTLARWPNDTWAYIKKSQSKGNRRAFFSYDNLPLNFGSAKEMQVHIYAGNDWYDQYVGIKSLDPLNNRIELDEDTSYALEAGRRFYIRNTLAALDVAGEWFYDKNKETLTIAKGSESYQNGLTASFLQNIIQIKEAHDLIFKDISFSYSRGNAISLEKSNNINFDNISISHVDSWAMTISGGNNVSINNSHIYDTGEGGVMLMGGDRKKLIAANHEIVNTHIHDMGKIIKNSKPAISLQGVGNSARNNLIHTGPSNGITFAGNDHMIINNELHHLCEMASDCGAIYTGRDWTYRGNIIENNWIHHIQGWQLNKSKLKRGNIVYAHGGVRGIYLDDAVSGVKISKNYLHDINGMLIQIGGGRDNAIENNILIADNAYAIFLDNRWPDYDWQGQMVTRLNKMPYQNQLWTSKYPELSKPMSNFKWPEGNRIQRNIIIRTIDNPIPTFRYLLPAKNNIIRNNIVWNTEGNIKVDFLLLDSARSKQGNVNWKQWIAEGVETDSYRMNPCLIINNRKIDITCTDSPIGKINMSLPELENIGLH